MRTFLARAFALIASFILVLCAVPTAAGATTQDVQGEQDDAVTWMVRPSDGVGEDGRSWVEQTLDPGRTVTEHLLVRNLSPRAITFYLSAADGYFTENGRFNMLTTGEESTDAGTWIAIAPTVEVGAGEDAIVPFTIAVPDNATPGDHPAGVAAAIRSGADEEVGVESRVGFRVMTRVSGELAPAATTRVSGTYDGSWNPFDPGRVVIDYSIENAGNARFAAAPVIGISTFFGLVRFDVPVDAISESAPGETRSGSATVPGVWPLFLYDITLDGVMDVQAVPGSASPTDAELPVATSAVVAIPFAQLATLTIAGLLLWWLWADRRRRDRRLADMLARARQEGREERDGGEHPHPAMTRRSQRATAGALALLAAIALSVSPLHSTQALADVEEDSGSVRVHVEVTPPASPSPTASPTSTPTRIPTPPGTDLPATGSPDVTGVALGAVLLAGVGAVAVIFSRRRAPRLPRD